MHNVLFLCTGNSARSIVAEVLLNAMSPEVHHGYSAGSHPVGKVNQGALQLLKKHGHDPRNLRSKSWDEFCGDQAPSIDTVITVCDNAAAESCPIWNGSPETLHWGLPDPTAAAGGAAQAQAFEAAYANLRHRIAEFLKR